MKSGQGISLLYFFRVPKLFNLQTHRGVTIDVAINEFETPHRKFTLLDAPGHRDFIPNMISGATQVRFFPCNVRKVSELILTFIVQADVALLVIDSTTGGFESGFNQGGQTREHAILVKSLGIAQLIVAVNKMDSSGFSQTRFDHVTQTLLPFLKQIGFKKDLVKFVPVSGFKGDNLLTPSPSLASWYSGPTLVEALDLFEVPKRDITKPFRMPIHDIYKSGMGGGLILDGRIESGAVQVGEAVCVKPGDEQGVIKSNLLCASLEMSWLI